MVILKIFYRYNILLWWNSILVDENGVLMIIFVEILVEKCSFDSGIFCWLNFLFLCVCNYGNTAFKQMN